MNWRRLLRRNWWDHERASEIEAYLEMETADNIARGMNPTDAADAARRKFGNPALIREEIYHMNSIRWFENIWQDLRYGLRMLRLSPGFATVAILSLALGIGANTAIFQLLNAVRLRSLPVAKAQELAEIRMEGGSPMLGVHAGRYAQLTRPIWLQIKAHQEAFSGAFAWMQTGARIGKGTETKRARAIYASGEIFQVLGIDPWQGRLLLPEDETASCPSTRIVVSYPYWQSELAGRDIAGGLQLTVNGELKEVVGVTPPDFFGLAVGETFDFIGTFCQPKQFRNDVFDIAVMGRLRSGWSLQSASSHLAGLTPGILAASPLTGYEGEPVDQYKRLRLGAFPGAAGVSALRETYDSSLLLLLAITGLVLLIACANLANLLLARANARQREVAVRLALGASRGRIVRQLLAESWLLALIGTVLGLALAQTLSRVLVWLLSSGGQKIALPADPDWRVFLFAAAVAVITCAVFGAAPAFRASSAQPVTAMKAGSRGMTDSREGFSLQRTMVVTQIAVSLVLLVGAFLFIRSFRNLMTFDPGMREAGITIAFIDFSRLRLPPERFSEFKRQLTEEVGAAPGILSVGTTTNIPLTGNDWQHNIHVGSVEGGSKFAWASPRYFQTMGIPIVSGRGIDEKDTATSTRVVVVNKTFVRQFVGAGNPLGQSLRTTAEPGYPETIYQIVGVIADTQYNDLRGKTPPMAIAPSSQVPTQGPFDAMMIYSNLPPAATLATVKSKLTGLHPEIKVDFEDFQERIRLGMLSERLMAVLSGFFGLLAAMLAMVGLYGMISYVVSRRRNEIGIRMALGAQGGQVVRMVMSEAGRLLAIGIVIGSALALAAGRTVGSLLFGLKAYDPATLLGACCFLIAVALGASFLPARRAAKLDPMAALRHE